MVYNRHSFGVILNELSVILQEYPRHGFRVSVGNSTYQMGTHFDSKVVFALSIGDADDPDGEIDILYDENYSKHEYDRIPSILRSAAHIAAEGLAWYIEDQNGQQVLELEMERIQHSEERLKRMLNFEMVLSKISARFVGVTDQLDDDIQWALGEMGKASGASRVYVFQLNEKDNTMDNTHEFCATGVESEIDCLKGLSCAQFPWWFKKLRNDEIILIEDVNQMPSESAREQEVLKSQDIQSILAFPLKVRGEMIGFIGFDNVESPGGWQTQDISILGVAADIISRTIYRREAESELKRLYKAIEQSDSMVALLDVNGTIGYANQQFHRCFSKQCEDGNSELLSFVNNENQTFSMAELIQKTEEGSGDYVLKTQSDELQYLRVKLSKLLDYEGGLEGYLMIVEDQTIEMQIKEQLRETNSELNEYISQMENMQNQVIQQGQLAGIGQLAAGIAHEINNPLGFVYSNFDILIRYVKDYIQLTHEVLKEDPSKRLQPVQDLVNKIDFKFREQDVLDLLEEALEGVERVKTIVKSLQAFSAVDHLDVEMLYDINEGINNTLLLVESSIEECARVHLELKPVPSIVAYGGQMNQVILNLLTNAVDAIKLKDDLGKGDIWIKTWAESEMIYFEVKDNGAGINKEDLTTIFNPFFTTKPVGMGTGLGLSSSYNIVVERHKGWIEAQSDLGQGSCFTVKLPLEKEGTLFTSEVED